MQQGAEGTERFCIKQLLKPIDNVSHLASVWCSWDVCVRQHIRVVLWCFVRVMLSKWGDWFASVSIDCRL